MPDWVLLKELDKLERVFLKLPCVRPFGMFSLFEACPHCKALKTVKNLKVYAVNKRPHTCKRSFATNAKGQRSPSIRG